MVNQIPVLFDMDNTTLDYNGGLYKQLITLVPNSFVATLHTHRENVSALEKGRPWFKALVALIKRQPNWWRDLEKLPLGWDVLHEAREAKLHPSILTKAPWSNATAAAEKLECIWKHFGVGGIPVNIVTEKKDHVYGKVLVEDWPDYLKPWLDKRPRGHGILIDQPYNRSFSHERVIRYDGSNIAEVRALFKSLSEQFS